MPRALWKGHLSFGLVMIPVALYAGESSRSRLDLDMLDGRDLGKIRYKRVNEQTGEEVPWDEIVKAYKLDDRYIVLEPEDFKRAASDVTRGVEIVEFVDAEAISPLLHEKPYFVEPGKGGEKAYTLLRDTLRESGRVGIARMVLNTREHLAVLMPVGDVLALITLRYADELNPPEDVRVPEGARAKASAKELAMAQQLVEGMTAEWDPAKYTDHYHEALRQVIEEKAGERVVQRANEPEPETTPERDIMDLLKRSLEQRQAGGEGTRRAPAGRRATRTHPGRAKRAG